MLATPEIATEYARWFVNRLAYTRQSVRPHPESGRHYYYRPRAEGGGELGLELEDVRRHLAGEITLGIYAINPETQRVKWMGIDADYKRSLDDLLKLQYELQQDGIKQHWNRVGGADIFGFCLRRLCLPSTRACTSGTWPESFRCR